MKPRHTVAATAAWLLVSTNAYALFDNAGLDPAFCQLKTIRQTVVYIDDMMMVDTKTEWATKISGKLKATLTPGERVTVVQLSPGRGQSTELWSGCWPNYTAEQRANLSKQNFFFSKNPIDNLADQQTFFLRDFGAALTKVYLEAKRPENQVHFDAGKPPQKQIVRALASDEGRFANSQVTIRAVVYSDMMENSDLGSVLKPPSGPAINYAEKLGSHLRKSVFYAFGVAEYVTGVQSAQETAKVFWGTALKNLSAALGGFGADLNVSNLIPVQDYIYNADLKFDSQQLDGKISILVDSDGSLVDSWIGFSRLTIAGLSGTFRCQNDVCKLDAFTTSGITTNSPSEVVIMTGRRAGLDGQLGIKGTNMMFNLKAEVPGS